MDSIHQKRLTKSVQGRVFMSCPRCESAQDILSYTPMERISTYELETMPIYKCQKCSWLFAPTDSPLDSGRL